MQFILLAIFKEMIFNHLDFCIKFLKHQKKMCIWRNSGYVM